MILFIFRIFEKMKKISKPTWDQARNRQEQLYIIIARCGVEMKL